MTAPLIIPEGIAAAEEPFEPKSAPCPSCSTSMTVTAGGVQGLTDHLERCQAASEEEREFYREHRRWPKTAEQKTTDNARQRERRQEKKQMTNEQKAEYAAQTKAAVEGARRDQARRAAVIVPPLPCRGGCGLDLMRGSHPPKSKCSHAPKWRKFFEEDER